MQVNAVGDRPRIREELLIQFMEVMALRADDQMFCTAPKHRKRLIKVNIWGISEMKRSEAYRDWRLVPAHCCLKANFAQYVLDQFIILLNKYRTKQCVLLNENIYRWHCPSYEEHQLGTCVSFKTCETSQMCLCELLLFSGKTTLFHIQELTDTRDRLESMTNFAPLAPSPGRLCYSHDSNPQSLDKIRRENDKLRVWTVCSYISCCKG